MKYFLALCFPLGLGVFIYGGYEAFNQHTRITKSASTTGVVLKSSLKSATKDSYRPNILFQYEVDGRTYESDEVFATDDSGSRAWAVEIRDRYPQGQQVDVWYNHDDPSQAFLIKKYLFAPYGIALAGLFLCFLTPPLVIFAHRQSLGPPEPEALPDGWYRIHAPSTLSRAVRNFGLYGVGWIVAGILTCAHFFIVDGFEGNAIPLAIVGGWVLIGMLWIGVGGYAFWLYRWMDDAYLLINSPRPLTGQTLYVRVEQQVKRSNPVKSMRVELICEGVERKWVGNAPADIKTKLYSDERVVLESYQPTPGETVAADLEFPIPYGMPASTPADSKKKKRTVWKLKLRTRLHGVPPCPDEFALTVDPGAPLPPNAHAWHDDSDDEVIEAEIIEE
ncbi:MAG: DUF3592 domain-containing protein [Phycisphaerae bacterium]|nr:DUF3592 domain-containing protein [Phycisphaerales bacterium]